MLEVFFLGEDDDGGAALKNYLNLMGLYCLGESSQRKTFLNDFDVTHS